MDAYKRMNLDFALQSAELKRMLAASEVRITNLTVELLEKQSIIVQQQNLLAKYKRSVEAFVLQCSHDLNDFLNSFVADQSKSATLVTDFVKLKSDQMQELLLGVNVGFCKDEKERKSCRPNQSLPELREDSGSSPEEPSKRVEEESIKEEILERDIFVTKRRRSPPSTSVREAVEHLEQEVEVYDDGLLATIAEMSEEEESEPSKLEEPNEIPDENDENLSLNVNMVCSTPNEKPKTTGIHARVILSPLDQNVVSFSMPKAVKANRRTTKMLSINPADETGSMNQSSRPRRRAAPQSMAEPSLRTKMRR